MTPPENEPTLQPQSAQIDLSKVPLENPDNVRPVYSNNINVIPTSLDFRFIFTEVVPLSPTSVSHEIRAHVVLGPTQAKALLMLMAAHLQQYEKDHGEIKVQWPSQALASK